MKKIIKDYFTFTKKERVAVIVLLVLMAAFFVLPGLFKRKEEKAVVPQEMAEQLASLQEKNNGYDSNRRYRNYNNDAGQSTVKAELFYFDPNTLSEEGFVRLGLRPKTAHTIVNYRSKGGRFRSPEDIRKIWGLRPEEANRIIPYIRMQQAGSPKPNIPVKPAIINVATATANEFKFYTGNDASMPFRIIKYREKLGGFIRVEQLKETFGMSDSLYESMLPHLTITSVATRKININTASVEELDAHPYIDKAYAKGIVQYRQQHGNYTSVQEIMKLPYITENLFNKTAPYFTVE
jgi:competence ComEA-like helix-hairpin-helix protein